MVRAWRACYRGRSGHSVCPDCWILAELERLAATRAQALCPKAPPAEPALYNVSDIFDEQFRALSCHLDDGDHFPDVAEEDFLRWAQPSWLTLWEA